MNSRHRGQVTKPGSRSANFLALILILAGCTAPGSIPQTETAGETPTPAAETVNVSPVAPAVTDHPTPAEVELKVRIDAGVLPDEPEAPLPAPDLLTRLAASLELKDTDHPAVAAQRKWFVAHPDYMNRVFLRSSRYLKFIMDELDRRGMPADIALLPIVESAFDPFAYSHGRAAGLWQFIPGTARRFGVKQNWWYDGRRDVLDSTRAAIDYLQYLHREFNGDWQLAIAGYNSGEGNVHRAIRRNQQKGKPTDFWHLRLPRETSAYVPKLLALCDIVSDPARYGLSLPVIEDEAYFAEVALDGQIDLAQLAGLADTEIDEIYALNPGFNRWATDPDGPHRALVPVEKGPILEKALAESPASARLRWVRHRIRPGDSLITIARQHETTPEVLRNVNGIRGNLIRAGDYMMIPTATRDLSAYTQSADLRLARTQSKPRGRSKVTHTVRPGDSLWKISRQYKVSTRSLAKWNGMAPGDTLSVGRRIVVWTNQAASASAQPVSGDRVRKIRYTVRNGDSLYKISSRFNVSMGQIKSWNSLDEKKYLQPGQRLVMYVDVTRQSGG